MPTTNERREVAARLRECADSGLYAERNAAALIGVVLFTTKANVKDTSEEIMRRLADLIEPEPERTCELEPSKSGKRRCKRCGAFVSVDAVWDCCGIIPTRYCPNCGAKAVSA